MSPSREDRTAPSGPGSARADARSTYSPLEFLGRSLLPIVALVLILGTFVWGPWVTLGLTVAWWVTITRIA